MSLANTTQLEALEYRFEQMRLALQQQAQVISGLRSDLANLQQGGGQGGGGIVYFIAPIVIAAGGSATGQTIQVNIGGVLTPTATTAAVVWNMMSSATSATSGHPIIVGPNPDGSYSVITQSC